MIHEFERDVNTHSPGDGMKCLEFLYDCFIQIMQKFYIPAHIVVLYAVFLNKCMSVTDGFSLWKCFENVDVTLILAGLIFQLYSTKSLGITDKIAI